MRSPFHGPPPALPGPLDRAAERWAHLPPRLRIALVVAAVMLLGALQANRLNVVQTRWGGEGQLVWLASATVAAGQPVSGAVERVRLPAVAVPPGAVTGRLPDDASLSLPLVEGAVLTEVHLAAEGPAAALPSDQRVVPLPVDPAWGVEAGTLVDVWAVADRDRPPEPLAQARTIVQLTDDGPRPVALIAVQEDEVATITGALARGQVLVTLRGRASG
ncbi:hypothetical protein [Euzebya sp.]|uniref:hypothetical protein n=1 Tax=Euzebya sp. TaxID=1971409 RepID=UPI0035171068